MKNKMLLAGITFFISANVFSADFVANVNPLHYAVSIDKSDYVSDLIAGDPKLASEFDKDGLTPIHLAIKNNSIRSLKEIFRQKINPNIKNSKNETPLIYAIKNKNIEAIKFLLSINANVNIPDNDGYDATYYLNNSDGNVKSHFIKNSEKKQENSNSGNNSRAVFKKELKSELKSELRPSLVLDIKTELINDLKNNLVNDLKSDLNGDIKDDLNNTITTQIKKEINEDFEKDRAKFSMSIKDDLMFMFVQEYRKDIDKKIAEYDLIKIDKIQKEKIKQEEDLNNLKKHILLLNKKIELIIKENDSLKDQIIKNKNLIEKNEVLINQVINKQKYVDKKQLLNSYSESVLPDLNPIYQIDADEKVLHQNQDESIFLPEGILGSSTEIGSDDTDDNLIINLK